MKRCALYVRVSTHEQRRHGLSVDSQIEALQQFCVDNRYEIADIYNDAGFTARKTYKKRPALLRLLDDCKAGKIDLVLFTKLDRWFRSVPDYYEVQKILDDCHIPWRTIWEDYETETSAGVFKVNIMLSVAQSEADRTSERIKNVFDYKRAQGHYIGQVPFGYIRKDGRLYKDEENAEYASMIFDLYIQTRSLRRVLYGLAEHGLKRSICFYKGILVNPVYTGFYNDGQEECYAYISKEKFDLIQDIMASGYRRPTKNPENVFLFSSLCTCKICESKLKSKTVRRNGYTWHYYQCSKVKKDAWHLDTPVNLSERRIEKYLIQNIDSLLHEYNIQTRSKNASNDIIDFEKQKRKLEDKLSRIGIRFEEGDISTEEYKEKRRAISEEIALLKKPAIRKEIQMPTNWKDIYEQLDNQHKQAFWSSIIKTIYIAPNGKIEVVFV